MFVPFVSVPHVLSTQVWWRPVNRSKRLTLEVRVVYDGLLNEYIYGQDYDKEELYPHFTIRYLPLCDGGLKTVTSQGHGRVQHWSDAEVSVCQPARCEDPLDCCYFFPLVLWKIAPWFTLSVLLIVLYVRPSVTIYFPELLSNFLIGFPQICQICFTYFLPVSHRWVLTEKLIVPQLTDEC